MEILVVGAGIGGLTLGLMLHRAGIACRIFEAAPELKAVGVGINILPHASRELCALGLEQALAKVAVTTREFCFYNRFGQFIYSEPAGRFCRLRRAAVLHPSRRSANGAARRLRPRAPAPTRSSPAGAARVSRPTATRRWPISRTPTAKPLPPQRAAAVVSAEGIHSTLRKQLYPDEGPPKYSGINMWRGVTRWKPMLTGASMVRIGWHHPAKLLIYPIPQRYRRTGPPTGETGWSISRRRSTAARLEIAAAGSMISCR